jgi:hypothetical protein
MNKRLLIFLFLLLLLGSCPFNNGIPLNLQSDEHFRVKNDSAVTLYDIEVAEAHITDELAPGMTSSYDTSSSHGYAFGKVSCDFQGGGTEFHQWVIDPDTGNYFIMPWFSTSRYTVVIGSGFQSYICED